MGDQKQFHAYSYHVTKTATGLVAEMLDKGMTGAAPHTVTAPPRKCIEFKTFQPQSKGNGQALKKSHSRCEA